MTRQAALLLLLGAALGCGRAPGTTAPAAGATPRHWDRVAALLDSAIRDKAAPGAVIGVSLAGKHFYYGSGVLGQDDSTRPDSSSIYDLASLTKVIGLTTTVLMAVTEQKLAVDAPLARYLPVFEDSDERRAITLRLLLTHSSGLPAGRPLYREASSRAEAFAIADTTPLDTVPGTRFVYSDLGAILLTQAVESVYHTRIDSLLAQRIFEPLALHDTRYLPPSSWLSGSLGHSRCTIPATCHPAAGSRASPRPKMIPGASE